MTVAAGLFMFSYQDASHQVVGPVTPEEIRRLIGSGAIDRNSLLRREGTDFWQAASRFEEFLDLLPPVRPDDGPAKSDAAPPPVPAAPAADQVVEVDATVSPPDSGPTTTGKTPEKEPEAAPQPAPESTASASEAEPSREAADQFFMIGGDGREYGPVTAAQLREWITQRRADSQTRVRRADGKEYAALGTLPEFAEALNQPSTSSPPPPAPPPLDSAKAEQLAAEFIGRGIQFSVGSCFSRSWKLYTQHFGILLGTTALALIILSTLHSFAGLGNVVAIALGGVLWAGLGWVFLKLIRGGRSDVGDLFAGINRGFLPLILASTIVFVLTSAGYLLCILPGVYLTVAWLFTYQLIYEHNLDFWPAMELSRKVVHERWWELFALVLGAATLFVLGLMAAIVGVLFTAPLAFGAIMYAYEDIFGERPE